MSKTKNKHRPLINSDDLNSTLKIQSLRNIDHKHFKPANFTVKQHCYNTHTIEII